MLLTPDFFAPREDFMPRNCSDPGGTSQNANAKRKMQNAKWHDGGGRTMAHPLAPFFVLHFSFCILH
ncbi:MAG TPA: hypothetical protein VFI31_24750 [Pirellulales bacterium]|nr:hypothetical protein [Pirellulales bacterium]